MTDHDESSPPELIPLPESKPLTATQAKINLDKATEKAPPYFPFTHRSRWEIAYCILVWEILKGMEGHDSVHRSVLLKGLTKAAGELS